MRLNGGEFLLNLLMLGALTISSESVTITDESVIKQLTGLKEYIDNQRSIKPLFVKFNNGSEIIVAKGEVRKFIDNTDFILYARTKTSSIEINVSFTQRVDANENPIDDYYIADGDATLTFTNEVQIFENIVDKEGHSRFIEGEIEVPTVTGLTKLYGKWSLSGSHLMFVICGKIDNGTNFGGYIGIAKLPDWIMNKIRPITSIRVAYETFIAYSEDLTSTQNLNVSMTKDDVNNDIRFYAGLNATADRYFRVAFDLLIDNESSENAGE